MAKIEMKELDAYLKQLDSLGHDSDDIIKRGVYEGAQIVADAIKEGLKTIPIDNRYVKDGEKLNGVTKKQKSDLINSFGLAPMRNEKNEVGTKCGFDGYGSIKTKKYPQGVPNALLMRSVESGSSVRKKTPVIRRAVNSAKNRAIDAMDKKINEELSDRLS